MASIPSIVSLNDGTFCANVVAPTIARLQEINQAPIVGVLNALSTSGINAGVIESDSLKDKPSATSYRKLYTRSEVSKCDDSTPPVDLCNLGAITASYEDNRKLIEHRIDLTTTRRYAINAEDFKQLCDNPDEYLQRRISADIRNVQAEINDKLTIQLIAYMGAYAGQTPPNTSITAGQEKSLSFFNQTYNGQAFVKDEYAKLGFTMAQPVYIGGSYIQHLLDSQTRLVGYNRDGYTTPAIQNIFVDYGIDTIFADGKSHILTFLPESFGLLNYNDVNIFNTKFLGGNVKEKRVVASPYGDPFKWDYILRTDDSGCVYEIIFQTHYDLASLIAYNCLGKPALHFLAQCTENNCAI